MNWGSILKSSVGLFLADFLAGFIAGGSGLYVSLSLSLLLAAVIFAILAYHQAARPFLHSALALLLYFGLSQLLSLFLPAWVNGAPLVSALGWLTSLLAFGLGTSAGWLVRANRRARADA